MKYGIKFTRPDTKPTIIVIELVIIRMNRRKLLYQEQLLMDYIHKTYKSHIKRKVSIGT